MTTEMMYNYTTGDDSPSQKKEAGGPLRQQVPQLQIQPSNHGWKTFREEIAPVPNMSLFPGQHRVTTSYAAFPLR